jgi:hypothetical protein
MRLPDFFLIGARKAGVTSVLFSEDLRDDRERAVAAACRFPRGRRGRPYVRHELHSSGARVIATRRDGAFRRLPGFAILRRLLQRETCRSVHRRLLLRPLSEEAGHMSASTVERLCAALAWDLERLRGPWWVRGGALAAASFESSREDSPREAGKEAGA